MPLSAGEHVGPYQVVAALGAGGMGEVYRARDERLGREVALKVLPADRAGDTDRLERFTREARAVAALDHPHILALHDIGSDGGRPYVVFELVAGQTLRQRLGHGPLPARKAVDYAVQICRGLAAAHARGIVHRDLKPENLALTPDGRVKILDFGLAHLKHQGPAHEHQTGTTASEPGAVLGTVGYMSPEQVRGRTVDARSDLFGLGAVLYEMVSGKPAFDGATAADRISAILSTDPLELTAGAGLVPPGLVPIVRRCLEKEPDERFQTARDLAFALESLAGSAGAGGAAEEARARRRRPWQAAGVLGLLALAAFGLWQAYARPAPLLSYKQLSFRRGMILDARFTADGHTVVYSGLFDGAPAETYSIHLSRSESLRLDLPAAGLFGVSSSGELAIRLGRPDERRYRWLGTLARVPLSGGTPREVLEEVYAADWAPDGRELAVIRFVDGEHQLEYPDGRVLRRPVAPTDAGFAMRVSPDGSKVAFNSGFGVTVVDRGGRASVVKTEASPTGLAWDPSGDAVWVALSKGGQQNTGLWRLGLDGSAREAVRLPGAVMIHDVARNGRLLVHMGFEREGIRVQAPGEAFERDVCPLSWCEAPELSADGRTVILRDYTDKGQGGEGWLYMRPTSGGAPIRLGEGVPLSLGTDGRWALIGRTGPSGVWGLSLLPTRSGTPRPLNTSGLSALGHAWLSGTQEVFLVAKGPDSEGRRTYLVRPDGAQPMTVTPAGIRGIAGPVRGHILASAPDGTLGWYPIGGGPPRPAAGKRATDGNIAGLSADGRYLFEGVFGVPGRIDRLDLTSGRRTLWKTVQPEDAAGVVGMFRFAVTPDGSAYAYNYLRLLQDLYLIEGVH